MSPEKSLGLCGARRPGPPQEDPDVRNLNRFLPALIVATAIAVLGQLYHVERRLPVVEPDALLMILVICGALVLVFRLSS